MSYTPKQLEFIEKARQRISQDPRSRLSSVTKDVIERNNFVFDAHCHLFDSKCINVMYLAIRMIAGIPEMLKPTAYKILTGNSMPHEMKIASTKELVENIYDDPSIIGSISDVEEAVNKMKLNLDLIELERATSNKVELSKLGLGEFLRRCRFILNLLGSKKMEDVYKSFRDKYGIHHVNRELSGEDCELVTIALGMDLNMAWDNSIKKSQQEQNKELSELSAQYPVLPFLPIDPRRADHDNNSSEENLYDVFLSAFDSVEPKFFGVKCYPALGYAPTDSRLKPIFQICAEKNIPIMTHCGGESVSTFAKPLFVNRNGIEQEIKQSTRTAKARILNEPIEWAPVLEEFQGLKLCFGHFGSGKAWSEPNSIYSKRVQIIMDLMKKHQVYSDFSFNLESEQATAKFMEKLKEDNEEGDLIRSRTMFGTDFWVVLPMSNLNLDQRKFLDQLGVMKENLLRKNVISFLGLV
ncbi:hypothetical protein EZ428_12520 [Pedobacter frigiditerrae]|uniref:Amidohydrolase-related domain-containing protein n=1 Tax=Pedobacter frigiditerrae TaxID=2530452 RepID=A0A4V2MIE3_9SPHI|nr:amidohydrolase family protein [Pedobacter frigiditerrae]TCC90106.1 hypothetical protein EZ428_12520 [Pedobacter frigiditerrae]